MFFTADHSKSVFLVLFIPYAALWLLVACFFFFFFWFLFLIYFIFLCFVLFVVLLYSVDPVKFCVHLVSKRGAGCFALYSSVVSVLFVLVCSLFILVSLIGYVLWLCYYWTSSILFLLYLLMYYMYMNFQIVVLLIGNTVCLFVLFLFHKTDQLHVFFCFCNFIFFSGFDILSSTYGQWSQETL